MFNPLAVASEIVIEDDVDVIPDESVVVIPTKRLDILLPIFSSSALIEPSFVVYQPGNPNTLTDKVGADTVGTTRLTVNVLSPTFS